MKSPAFQFYPDDFMGGAPATMEPTETHVYVWLLCRDWNQNGFVFDPKALAKWCRVSRVKFDKAWRIVQSCFLERDGRMYNPRLEKERVKQAAWRDKSSKGGQKSAEGRKHHPTNGGSRVVEPEGNILFPSLSPTPLLTNSKDQDLKPSPRSRKKTRDVEPAPTWVQELTPKWLTTIGSVTHARLGKALKPIVDAFGVEAVNAAIEIYASSDEGPRNGVRRVEFFANDFAHWHRLAQTPLVDEYGVLTERGRKIGGTQ